MQQTRSTFRASIAVLPVLALIAGGCATIRVTDPPRTATEQFLMSVATTEAIEALSDAGLRDRRVFIDTSYLTAARETSPEVLFLIGELRSRLLTSGVRLVSRSNDAQIVLELRSSGIGIDRTEFLLGIPALYLPTASETGVPLATPELAIIKSTKQRGYASVAYVAYWSDSGEVVANSGPFVGRTFRDDWWFFGFGPRTIGDIPPTEPVRGK